MQSEVADKDKQLRIMTDQNSELLRLLESEESLTTSLQGEVNELRSELNELKQKHNILLFTAKTHEELATKAAKEGQLRAEEIRLLRVEGEQLKQQNTGFFLFLKLIFYMIIINTFDHIDTQDSIYLICIYTILISIIITIISIAMYVIYIYVTFMFYYILELKMKTQVEVEALQEQLRVRKEKQYQLLEKLQAQEEAKRQAEDQVIGNDDDDDET